MRECAEAANQAKHRFEGEPCVISQHVAFSAAAHGEATERNPQGRRFQKKWQAPAGEARPQRGDSEVAGFNATLFFHTGCCQVWFWVWVWVGSLRRICKPSYPPESCARVDFKSLPRHLRGPP